MICARCHCENPDQSKFCKACGHLLAGGSADAVSGADRPAAEQPHTAGPQQQQQPRTAASSTAPYANRPSGTVYRPYTPPARIPFDWRDICGISGFVFSIIAWFWLSIILFPLGLAGSLIGMRSKNTRGISVAGVVLAVLGVVIKVFWLLAEYNLLPYWITSGIFR